MPICVFDIMPDGTPHSPEDTALTGPGTYRWWHFDLSDPELASWAAEHLDPIPAAALQQPETRPRCDAYKDGLILNLRGINMNEGQPADQMVSVRMWVTPDAIVTVRVRKVFALNEMREDIEAGRAPATAAAFLDHLINRLTNRIQGEVLRIAELINFYEADLENKNTAPPAELPQSRRQVIRMRRYLEPQRSALDSLLGTSTDLIGPEDALSLRELANSTALAVEELSALQERIVAVQDEHDLQVAQKQADHGYRLSVAAAVFLPLGFLTGLFGVNVAGMPGIDNPLAFAILCGALAGVSAVLVIILRLNRWL